MDNIRVRARAGQAAAAARDPGPGPRPKPGVSHKQPNQKPLAYTSVWFRVDSPCTLFQQYLN